jgi:hypothetical protein
MFKVIKGGGAAVGSLPPRQSMTMPEPIPLTRSLSLQPHRKRPLFSRCATSHRILRNQLLGTAWWSRVDSNRRFRPVQAKVATSYPFRFSPLARASADGENETGRERPISMRNQRDRQFESTLLHQTVIRTRSLRDIWPPLHRANALRYDVERAKPKQARNKPASWRHP